MVAAELRTGRVIRLWQDELRRLAWAPFDTGPMRLFVAYFASAELSCFEALGWPHPERIIDLFCEFRAATNGAPPAHGNGLIGALLHYGLPAWVAKRRTGMRALIMTGGPWSADERAAILAYCEEDVLALERLLPVMLPEITSSSQRLGWALLRGRYMAAVARMEWNGVPIDAATLSRLQDNWETIKDGLISEVDRDYGVYEGRSFRLGAVRDHTSLTMVSRGPASTAGRSRWTKRRSGSRPKLIRRSRRSANCATACPNCG